MDRRGTSALALAVLVLVGGASSRDASVCRGDGTCEGPLLQYHEDSPPSAATHAAAKVSQHVSWGADEKAQIGSTEGVETANGEENSEEDGPAFLGPDLHDGCPTWARDVDEETGLRRCESDRPFMLSECPESCLQEAGISVETLSEEQLTEDAIAGYGYLLAEDYGEGEEECDDWHDECENWADSGECIENADFMLTECQRSCLVCFEPGVHAFDFGVEQRVEFYDVDKIRDRTIDVIRETLDYMVDEVMVNEKFEGVRRDCRNDDEKCSYWSARGDCDGGDEVWMQQYCTAACQTCLSVEYWHRCKVDPEVHKDIFKKGDLNAMFERIMEGGEHAQFRPAALSRPYHPGEEDSNDVEEERESLGYVIGPWIIRLDEFLSEKESDHLIFLGHEMEFERSTEVSGSEKNEDGTYKDDIPTEGRTSSNSWCSDECYVDPVATLIRERIINLTGVPEENSEHFQLLKYEVGQKYELHHDYIVQQEHLRCGPRILTVFMYLNDVEEGGQTSFPSLNLTVAPKRGTALIWPSVLDEDPEEIDERTFHMALPVKKGQKFGANAWLHLRDYTAASDIDCV